MKRRRSILLIIAALLLVVPLVLMWPEGPLDLSKDEEPFRSMVLPPKEVTGDIIMDGGSVVVELIDAAGKPYEIHFAIDYATRGHPTAAWRPGKIGKRVPLKNPARAKAISKRLWSDYARNGDEGVKRALDYLSPISELTDRWGREYRGIVHRWGF